MKVTKGLFRLIFIVFTQMFFLSETGLVSGISANDSWKNWYSIVVRGTPEENARYAKQMGYDYIAIHWRG
ncbi:MAG: hypothetical protein L6Q53_18005, partial [Candidatus Brocadia sinica]|nr:hypothetical protein [Candidatus Brocadia sinica]